MSTMIPDPENYFAGFIPQRRALLKTLEKEAAEEMIPIVGPVVGELLHILVTAMQSEKVLELGTATGYSAIYMAAALQAIKNGHLTTIELSDGLVYRARKNFKNAGLEDRITVLPGDCRTIMGTLSRSFDVIFMDIDKAYYMDALPLCEKVLRVGGLLIVDNTAFSDAMDFNAAVSESPKWRSVNLLCRLPGHSPENDGLCLAVKQ